MQYYYMKIFFWWEKGLHRRFVSSTGGVDVPITNGSRYEPAVMGAHHQRLAHASPPVYEPAVMNPLHHRRFWNRRWWPRYHHRLKSNSTQNRWWCTFRTGGDRGGCSSASSRLCYPPPKKLATTRISTMEVEASSTSLPSWSSPSSHHPSWTCWRSFHRGSIRLWRTSSPKLTSPPPPTLGFLSTALAAPPSRWRCPILEPL